MNKFQQEQECGTEGARYTEHMYGATVVPDKIICQFCGHIARYYDGKWHE